MHELLHRAQRMQSAHAAQVRFWALLWLVAALPALHEGCGYFASSCLNVKI
jgi:hypothetical protein